MEGTERKIGLVSVEKVKLYRTWPTFSTEIDHHIDLDYTYISAEIDNDTRPTLPTSIHQCSTHKLKIFTRA